MAELPFTDPTALQPEVPQPPKATGLRRVVIAVIATVVCVGLAAIVLFGTRAAHRLGQRTAHQASRGRTTSCQYGRSPQGPPDRLCRAADEAAGRPQWSRLQHKPLHRR